MLAALIKNNGRETPIGMVNPSLYFDLLLADI
jgi:hypothetical protein